ncbi:Histone-lysine N-methyltransferase SUV39H2, partial [Dufourea novaeangliae]
FSTREKRPASPGNIEPSAKQVKYEQQFNSSATDNSADCKADKCSSSSNENSEEAKCLYSNNALFTQDIEEQIVNENYVKRSSRCSESEDQTGVDNTRLNKLSNNNNVSANDNDSDTKNIQIKYNLENIKLKELKVILKDMKYDKNNGIKVSHPRNDLWEVEEILGKKELDDQSLYLIKWKNWDSDYNTWEPVSNLVNCPEMLEDFEANRLKLLNRFQRVVNFHPNKQDIEQFIKKLIYKGKTLQSITVQHDVFYRAIKNFMKSKRNRSSKTEFIKDGIFCMLIGDLRKKQLASLSLWENEMNSVSNGRPLIKVENVIDLEEAPPDFYYIDDYLPGLGVIIPNDPPIGCECHTCNSKTTCCFGQYGGYCPYTSTYKIRVPPGTPIYECNKRCKCDMNCINRVVQRGTKMKFCIFRTANGRGWGVKTLQSIRKGSFVTQYVGEVITSEEAEKRGKEYDAAGRTYLFDLDYNETEDQCPYTVDAAVYGNVSHFINHSCDPNLAVYAVWIDCLDPNLPKLALFATRDIKMNEEITFDYTCQTSRNGETSIRQDASVKNDLNTSITKEFQEEFQIRPETPESDTSNSKILCKCGARSCRQYLF